MFSNSLFRALIVGLFALFPNLDCFLLFSPVLLLCIKEDVPLT